MKYAIITPARNEAANIEATIQSVVNQTVLPVKWLIVNDGSTDGTREIVEKYASQFVWIELVNIEPFQIKEYSSRVVYLFKYGIEQLDIYYDIIVKLDADVTFAENFCENIVNSFVENPYLGIASGHLMTDNVKEKKGLFDNTRGATKFYRKKCLEIIGGLFPSTGWDVMDDAAARMNGWKTQTLNFFFNHKKEEGVRVGLIRKHFNVGKFNGRVPYHPLYFALKLVPRFFEKPYFLAPFIQIAGYFKTAIFCKERPFPKDVSKHLRKEQLARLKTIIIK